MGLPSLPNPTVVLVLVALILVDVIGIVGGIYIYGERRYAAGAANEVERQRLATAELSQRLDAYALAAQAAEAAARQAREALASKVGATLAAAPQRAPGAVCDYPEAVRTEINAIRIPGR